MDDLRVDDEIRLMYEDRGGNVLESKTFRAPLRDVPMKPALRVEADTLVSDVAVRLRAEHQSCALVMKGERLVGIFTERDALLRVIAGQRDAATTPVREVMTSDPDTLTSVQTIRSALHLMVNSGHRHVPVLSADGRPLGVVSAREIVAYLCEYMPEDLQCLPPRARDYMPRYGA